MDNLDLKAANGLSIQYESFIENRFQLLNSQPRKCNLFRREVQCLDRLVSGYGYRMDATKIQAVLSLKNKQPKTVSQNLYLKANGNKKFTSANRATAKTLTHAGHVAPRC